MKKWLALLLTLAMLLSFAALLSGCGDNTDNPEETKASDNTNTDATGEDTIGASIDLRSTTDTSKPETDP